MCGISGFWNPGKNAERSVAIGMNQAIFHRGPDGGDVWLDESAGIALCHRRLAIVDLSPAGHQPMSTKCGRFVIVFNGEIYNHLDIRAELRSRNLESNWVGHSDTETLLAAIKGWGVEGCLSRLVGMFSFAVWDKQEQLLTLARDRLGEKPLYFGRHNGTFLFGSELKAIARHGDFRQEINHDVLPLYFRYSYIPAPYTIYTGIQKLKPGHFIVLGKENLENPQQREYWSFAKAASFGVEHPFRGTAKEATETLDTLLRRSISGQMMADVPLGALLSGGVDSSAVVALMQALSSKPIKTFTIGFSEKSFNEAEHAKAVAKHLGTDHTDLYLDPDEALKVIPTLPELYDEPFADSSQIPTFLVLKLAKQYVTVALSGDGGDELFGGYSRYSRANLMYQRLKPMPVSIRRSIASVSSLFPPMPNGRLNRQRSIFKALLESRTEFDFYQQYVSHWLPSDKLLTSADEIKHLFNNSSEQPDFAEFLDVAMFSDSVTYLPDDILVKVDRAAMGVSLETRVPLLDHRIVEWAWHLPQTLRSGDGNEKKILRDLLYRYIPKSLVERPKMGFGVPIARWLRGPLREWAEELLKSEEIKREGILNPNPIHQKWREHVNGSHDWSYHLWDVLMFQAWLKHQKTF